MIIPCTHRNDGWYRGRFLGYNDEAKTEAVVLLVDYGNIHVANVVSDLRRDIYAERVPIMALRVELAGVTPTGPCETWTPECLDMIQEQSSLKDFSELLGMDGFDNLRNMKQ